MTKRLTLLPPAASSPASDWDPNEPRSELNFNPFERDDNGNSCGPDGYYPGETNCRPWTGPNASFNQMMAERDLMEQLEKDPKSHSKGMLGNYQGFNKMQPSSTTRTFSGKK